MKARSLMSWSPSLGSRFIGTKLALSWLLFDLLETHAFLTVRKMDASIWLGSSQSGHSQKKPFGRALKKRRTHSSCAGFVHTAHLTKTFPWSIWYVPVVQKWHRPTFDFWLQAILTNFWQSWSLLQSFKLENLKFEKLKWNCQIFDWNYEWCFYLSWG